VDFGSNPNKLLSTKSDLQTVYTVMDLFLFLGSVRSAGRADRNVCILFLPVGSIRGFDNLRPSCTHVSFKKHILQPISLKHLSDVTEYKAIYSFPLGYLEQKRIKFGEYDKNITKGKDVYFTATNIKDHTGILSENEEWRRVS